MGKALRTRNSRDLYSLITLLDSPELCLFSFVQQLHTTHPQAKVEQWLCPAGRYCNCVSVPYDHSDRLRHERRRCDKAPRASRWRRTSTLAQSCGQLPRKHHRAPQVRRYHEAQECVGELSDGPQEQRKERHTRTGEDGRTNENASNEGTRTHCPPPTTSLGTWTLKRVLWPM